jgi:protein tyrosine phosphatase (PTP) superfamily phosphohydrolase (DUF442 family)
MHETPRRPRPGRLVLSVAVIMAAAMAVYFGPFIAARFRPAPPRPPSTRPASWARPLSAPGLANLHKAADGLYCGAQPSAEGMRSLRGMGIRTVVNLRVLHSDGDDPGGAPGLEFVHIRVNPLDPDRDEVVKFLRVVGDPNRAPVYVHCQRGIDRTGLMCAVYRVAICGWTKAEALAEMTGGGFGYDDVFRNVPLWLEKLDVQALARQAGVPPATGPAGR